VAWVAERKEVLSAFFGFLSLLFYARYAQSKTGQRASGIGDYLSALFFFACGLMSKPMVVTLPLMMLLLDYWPLSRMRSAECGVRNGSLLLEKAPFLALAFVSGLVTIHAERGIGALASTEQYPVPVRIANAAASYVQYLWQMFWPVKLAFPYPHPGPLPWEVSLLTGIVVAGLCVAALWLGRSRPYVPVGWLWYVVTLLPVIGLIQVSSHARADRYTYVPLVGIFVVLVWGAVELCSRARVPRAAMVVAAVSVLAACAVRTSNQLTCWRNSGALFRCALAVTENNYVANNNLGIVLFHQGRLEEAMAHYREVVRLAPAYCQAWNNLGNALASAGRVEEARRCYLKAIQIKPDYAAVFNNLGLMLANTNRYAEAIPYLASAIQLKPDYVFAHWNLGNALAGLGRADEAIGQYRLALHHRPAYPEAWNALGNALAGKGQLEEAMNCYRRVLQINPQNADAWNNLGNALGARGKLEEAITCFRAALRLTPDAAEPHCNLGNALAGQTKYAEAIAQYQEALRLKPRYAHAENNLAGALEMAGRVDEALAHYQAALQLQPDMAVTRLNFGCSLAKVGRREEAIAQLKEAVRVKPDYPEAKQKLRDLGVDPF